MFGGVLVGVDFGMTLSWTSALRDLVSLTVLNRTFANLRAYEVTTLDNNQTGATVGGVAQQALTHVLQFAQWYEEAGATLGTAGPAAWEPVLAAEVCLRFARAVKPSDVPIMLEAAKSQWDAAFDSYSLNDASVNTIADQLTTLKMIRFHVIRHMIRQPRPRKVPVKDIDQASLWVINFLWNKSAWNFRVRNVTMTFTGDGIIDDTVTFNLPDSEEFGAFVSAELVYAGTSIERGLMLKYADSDKFNSALAVSANMDGDPVLGRPIFFTIEHRQAGDKFFKFTPQPAVNTTYTVYGTVAIRAPFETIENFTDTTPFDFFPDAFQPVIPDVVLGRIAKKFGMENGRELWKDAMDQVDSLLPLFDTRGTPDGYGVNEGDVNNDGYGWSRAL